jgi:hypothetical protein
MLKDSQIAKDVQVANKLLNQLNDSIEKINGYIATDKKEDLINELYNYENISERLVNNARLLPIISGTPKAKDKVQDIIIEENNIDICYTEKGWFYVKIPSLLPKKEKGDASYIRATLQMGMKKFFETHKKKRFTDDMTIIFKHNYAKERTYREFRDHDNIELNVVVDMIALYVLVDDSPMKLKHYYCSFMEESDSTEVYVIPTKDFKEWLIMNGIQENKEK